MAADPLAGVFGPQAADPLGSLFGPQGKSAPNSQWTSNPLAPPQGDQSLTQALSGGIAPKAPVDLSEPFREAPQVHPSSHDAAKVAAITQQQQDADYKDESWGTWATDKALAAQAGAVQGVGSAVRGIGSEVQRVHDTLSANLGDSTVAKAFVNQWFGPFGMQVASTLGQAADYAGQAAQNLGQGINDAGDAIGPAPERAQQTGNRFANTVGMMTGFLASAMVGGEGVVAPQLIGQGFDQIDQAMRAEGKSNTSSASQLTAQTAGGAAIAALNMSGLGVVAENLPLPIKNALLRGLTSVAIKSGVDAAMFAAQGIATNFAAKLGIDPNTKPEQLKDVFNGIGEQAETGGLVGLVLSSLTGRFGHYRPLARSALGEPNIDVNKSVLDAFSPDQNQPSDSSGAPPPSFVTPEDKASPLPTDLINEGKATVQKSLEDLGHNQILSANGMPDVGSRVSVTQGPDSATGTGSILGTFSVGDQNGTEHGIRVGMDDGSTYEELFKDIQQGGHSINELIDKYLPETANDAPLNVHQYVDDYMAGKGRSSKEHIQFAANNGADIESEFRNRHAAALPDDIVQGLIDHGVPPTAARAAAAGIIAESSNNANAVNPKSGALGLGQWLGSRKQAIIDKYGPNPTRAQQIEFLAHELLGGDPGGKSVLSAGSEEEALHAYITKFMRPAAGYETDRDIAAGLKALGSKATPADFQFSPTAADKADDQQQAGAQQSDDDIFKDDTPTVADQQAPASTSAADDFAQKASDYTPFQEDTLGIDRADMPQIQAEHRGAMVNFLNARGIDHSEETVPADSLKPTQTEFSPAKVEQAIGYTGGDRAILVSQDGYIVDGHHQWLAAKQNDAPVKVIRLDAPIRDVLAAAHAFPSSKTDEGSLGAQPAPTSAPAPLPRTEVTPTKFNLVWKSAPFKDALEKLPGGKNMAPDRTSPAAAEMVRGWIDGKAGKVEQFKQEAAKVAPMADKIDRPDNTFNPRQSYAEGYYAAATGRPMEIRAKGSEKGRFLGIQEAHDQLAKGQESTPDKLLPFDREFARNDGMAVVDARMQTSRKYSREEQKAFRTGAWDVAGRPSGWKGDVAEGDEAQRIIEDGHLAKIYTEGRKSMSNELQRREEAHGSKDRSQEQAVRKFAADNRVELNDEDVKSALWHVTNGHTPEQAVRRVVHENLAKDLEEGAKQTGDDSLSEVANAVREAAPRGNKAEHVDQNNAGTEELDNREREKLPSAKGAGQAEDSQRAGNIGSGERSSSELQHERLSKFNPLDHVAALKEIVNKGTTSLRDLKAVAKKLGLTTTQAHKVMGALAGQRNSGVYMSKKGILRRVAQRTAPMHLMEYVRSIGGVRSDRHDLRNLGNLARYPGVINNKSGRSVDELGEALHEAQYWHGHERPTEAEVLDLLDEGSRKRIYTKADISRGEEFNRQKEVDAEEQYHRDELKGIADEEGMKLPEHVYDDALQYVARGESHEYAIQAAVDNEAARSLEELDRYGSDNQEQVHGLYEGESAEERGEGAADAGDEPSRAGRREGESTPSREQPRGSEQHGAAADRDTDLFGESRPTESVKGEKKAEPETPDMFGGPTGEDVRKGLEKQTEGRARSDKEQKAAGADGGLFDTQDKTGDLLAEKPSDPVKALETANVRLVNDAKAMTGGTLGDRYNRLIAERAAELHPLIAAADAATDGKSSYVQGIKNRVNNVIPAHERPLAVKGLTSYRYDGKASTPVMIGARDDADALRQAKRSIDGEPDPAKLEKWDGSKYAPVEATKPVTPKPSDYGAKNKLVTKARADELRDKIRAKLRGQINSGIDPEMLSMGAELAAFHIEAGARKFADFAHAIAEDLGVKIGDIRQYLRAWYNGARDLMEDMGAPVADMDGPDEVRTALKGLEEGKHAPSTVNGLEPNRGPAAASDTVGTENVPAQGRGDGSGARGGVEEAGSAGRGQPEREGELPKADASAPRAGSDSGIRSGSSAVRGGASDVRGQRGSDAGGEQRLSDERTPAKSASEFASEAAQLKAKLEEQAKASRIPVKPRDPANIDETLPFLRPAQRTDVRKGEDSFAKREGFMLTNGTGTGKTYSGGGMVARMVREGKKDILIVAPSQDIVKDWKAALANLGVEGHILKDSSSPGKDVTLTTYANMGANKSLSDRSWHMALADESHKLMSSKDADSTANLASFRALTNHPLGRFDRAMNRLRKEWEPLEQEEDRLRAQGLKTMPDRLVQKRDELYAKTKALADTFANEPRSKALFMSATPFAYVKAIDYANGYLFDYDKEFSEAGKSRIGGYNQPSPHGEFFIKHFGYRMRTGKLTEPDAGVNTEVMEREFHEHLKREGALSGRALDVDRDYDRKFVTVGDAVGTQIDNALEFLSTAEEGKYRPLADMVRKKFDYLSRMRLLEAINAHHAVPIIQAHHALGRKVVVFHQYNEGGGFNPFMLDIPDHATADVYRGGKQESVPLKPLYEEFLRKNPYVQKMDFAKMGAPIDTLQKAFPDAMFYNGRVPGKQRTEAKRLFNEDNNGKNLIVVQADAGEAGISLHDTTGQHQRVIVNLGMPVRPMTAIQQEGRIYRVGQKSDAIFRYLTTGTGWERSTFAHKVAERASTAENLGMGDQARALKQSFIDAYSDAADNHPHPSEGVGGKELDRSNYSLSPYEKAKSYYYAQSKNAKSRDNREGADYYATPEPLGFKMAQWANLKTGEKALEPSAGHGAIARFLPEDTDRTVVEPSAELASRAALASPGARMLPQRFEDLHSVNKYDGIVMNPPFGTAGKTAMDHVAKAATHLRNGGRIVALIPHGKMDERFEKWMESDEAKHIYQVGEVNLPQSTFERAGTKINGRVVILEKQTDKESAAKLPQMKSVDLSHLDSNKALFDRLENVSFPDRVEPQTKERVIEPGRDGELYADGVRFKVNAPAEGSSFVAKPGFVPTAKFARYARLARQAGGDYMQGTGFAFPSDEARKGFLEAVERGDEGNTQVSENGAEPKPMSTRLELAETTHAKKGVPLYVASLGDRVETDEFARLRNIAKENGGYWSSYRGRGAIPGFQFESEAGRQAFVDKVRAGDTPMMQAPDEEHPPFYSALERAIQSSGQNKASGEQWLATLKKVPGVKQEELNWSGIEDYLKGHDGPVDKQSLVDLMNNGGIRLDERILGGDNPEKQSYIEDVTNARIDHAVDQRMQELEDNGDGAMNHFAEEDEENPGKHRIYGPNASEHDLYDTPEEAEAHALRLNNEEYGQRRADIENSLNLAEFEREAEEDWNDRNSPQFQSWSSDTSNPTYKELLMTLPEGEGRNPERAPSTHWDEPGVIAHTRFMDKKDAEGKRVLHVEEVQSDWHQKGRDQGYAVPESPEQRAKVAEAERALREAEQQYQSAHQAIGEQEKQLSDLAAPVIRRAYEAFVKDIDERSARGDAGLSDPSLVEHYKNVMASQMGYTFFKNHEARGEQRGYVGYNDLRGWLSMARQQLEHAGEHVPPEIDEGLEKINQLSKERSAASSLQDLRQRELHIAQQGKRGIPDAPFKSTWPALVMKRLIRYAADNGYDKIAWTPGEEQSRRYNLGAATGDLRAMEKPSEPGTYIVGMSRNAAEHLIEHNLGKGEQGALGLVEMTEPQMREAFGGDIAKRLVEGVAEHSKPENVMARETQRAQLGEDLKAGKIDNLEAMLRAPAETFRLDGEGLNVGGEGMRQFYDRNLVNITNDIIKKYGAKVENQRIPGSRNDALLMEQADSLRREADAIAHVDSRRAEQLYASAEEQERQASLTRPGFELTPQLKEAARSGLPLFQRDDESRSPFDDLSDEQKASFRQEVTENMKQLLPNDNVALQFANRLTDPNGFTGSRGQYFRRVISIAYHADKAWTLGHETVHAMKAMGLFTPTEWNLLVKRAWDMQPEMQGEVHRRWANKGLTPDQLKEEAVAELFGEHFKTLNQAEQGPLIKRLGVRVLNTIAAIHNAIMKALGRPNDVVSAHLLMEKMRSGEVGSRPVGYGEAPRDTATPTFGRKVDVRYSPDKEVKFDDPETEKRWNEANGLKVDGPSIIEKTKATAKHFIEGWTRHFEHLPNTPEFADAKEQLRKLEEAPRAAFEKTVRTMQALLGKLNPDEYDVLKRKAVLDDLMWEADAEHQLPFGFTPDTLRAERAKIDQVVANMPKVTEAIRQRKLTNRRIADEMVKQGILTSDQIKNPAYYRHMVLDYARAQVELAKNGGKMMVNGKPVRVQTPYWAHRKGSALDINSNLLEAEKDWMMKAHADIQTARTINWIKNSGHNIREQLRERAKFENKEAYAQAMAEDEGIAKQDGRFRSMMRRGFDIAKDAIDNNDLNIPAELQPAADALSRGSHDTNVFPLLSWLMDEKKPGSEGAAMVLSAAGGRKKLMSDTLKDKFTDPEDIKGLVRRYKPEGYTDWQPLEGQHLFTGKTVSQRVIDMFVSKLGEQEYPGVNQMELERALGQIRPQLVVGGDRYTMVIPHEIARTLNNFGHHDSRNMFLHFVAGVLSKWKQWAILNPHHAVHFNVNNQTGELDAMIAGKPSAFLQLGNAWRELRGIHKGEMPSQAYTDALERGVLMSGLTNQEVPDINQFGPLRHLDRQLQKQALRPDRMAVQGMTNIWHALKGTTTFRENLFRYAAYLQYRHELESGKPQVDIGYGGSNPALINAISDPVDKAAMLARELLGDYGDVSVFGQRMRKYVMPFWSWPEMNTKRYFRLTANAFRASKLRGLATGGGLGATIAARNAATLMIRMGLVYGVISMWNQLVHGDDERKLDEQQQKQLHLILGHDSKGQVYTLRMQGALSDVLDELGFGDTVQAVKNYEAGKGSLGKVAMATPAAILSRLGPGQWNPLYMEPIQIAMRKKLWPDFTHPRTIHDRGREAAQALSLENEYDWAMKRPSQGYGDSWLKSFAYKRDPGEMAYNSTRDLINQWMTDKHGIEAGSADISPKSEALRDYKMAMRYGDVPAAQQALQTYAKYDGTVKGFKESIKGSAPLHGLPKRDRLAFVESLNPQQREELIEAQRFFEETYLGRKSGITP